MTEATVETRVLKLMNAHMGNGMTPTLETRILADTSMDSVKVMDFLLELEDEFDVTISLNRLAEVETAGDLIREVQMVYQEN